MATVLKTIVLTQKHDDWIKHQISTAGYADASEVIRSLIQREQERSEESAPTAIAARQTAQGG